MTDLTELRKRVEAYQKMAAEFSETHEGFRLGEFELIFECLAALLANAAAPLPPAPKKGTP